MGVEHLLGFSKAPESASVSGLNQGDEDRSFRLVAVFFKEKGGSVTAETGVRDPPAHHHNCRKPSRCPKAPSAISPPYARVVAQLERINGHRHKVVILWKAQIPFSFLLQTFISYLAAQEWEFFIMNHFTSVCNKKPTLIPLSP